MASAPVAVEVWRDGRVESRHRVRACVADAAGKLVLEVGDIDEPVFPRSAVKPFLALALVESGAADALGVGEAELALACASHGGEPRHVSLVEAWLARLGLDEAALACGPHPPTYPPAAAELVRAGQRPRRLHNNCSGKHTGMLAAALHQRLPIAGLRAAGPSDPALLRRGRRPSSPASTGCRSPASTAAACPIIRCRCAASPGPPPISPTRPGWRRCARQRCAASGPPCGRTPIWWPAPAAAARR